ncbi:MAG: tRNA (adenosine(37)-N6)-threonylcarbamoyltransferase complex ATPase subunit type 1 TsaE [Clostridia bacterium]|nr:tRNA (adenosine(37)-N6)-threonylcarbamoyltransferase complex ATPase subunit type 1 TsaE [Clostridia bacterium]
MKKQIILKTEEDTKAFGASLAESINPGDIFALVGDLGTGKTTLAKSIAAALSVQEMIISPTFTIVCEYLSGRIPFYHFDVYRVHEEEELFEIGFEEYLEGAGVCVIEWGDLVKDILPSRTKWIILKYGENEGERICTSL